MEFLIWGVVPVLVVVAGPAVVPPLRDARAKWMARRAGAGCSVVVPAQLGLRSRRLAPRGALVRDGADVLWISRRPLGRAVRLDPATIDDHGRLVDKTGRSIIEWTYRDLEVRASDTAVLRVAEWYTPVVAVARRTYAQAPRRTIIAAAVPRWVLLLPLSAAIGFAPLLLAWANGSEVGTVVTGHDLEYERCEVRWETVDGPESAGIDCDLEPVGSSLNVRALGFPLRGEAADLWTLETVGVLIGIAVGASVLTLAVHLPVTLWLPALDPGRPAGTGEGRRPQPPRQRPTTEHADGSPWQRRALERAAVDGFRRRRPRRHLRPRLARWLRMGDDARAAAAGYAGGAVLCAVVALPGLVAATDLWVLSRSPTTLVRVEVVESGDVQLPFLTRTSVVRADADEELWLTTRRHLEDGATLTVVRAGDVLALPGDPGHRIDLAQGALALGPGCVLGVVAWRRARTALASVPGLARGDHEDVQYAAFRRADGTSLVALLESDGRLGLVVPVRTALPPVGVATVPESRQEGDELAPLVGGRWAVPDGPAVAMTDQELLDRLDG
ncbi:hypothetical protein [Thalassiella azotivora]